MQKVYCHDLKNKTASNAYMQSISCVQLSTIVILVLTTSFPHGTSALSVI